MYVFRIQETKSKYISIDAASEREAYKLIETYIKNKKNIWNDEIPYTKETRTIFIGEANPVSNQEPNSENIINDLNNSNDLNDRNDSNDPFDFLNE